MAPSRTHPAIGLVPLVSHPHVESLPQSASPWTIKEFTEPGCVPGAKPLRAMEELPSGRSWSGEDRHHTHETVKHQHKIMRDLTTKQERLSEL